MLAVFTGAAIYFPYCFVQFPQDAVAIGVAMHWCQYLAINYAVYGRHAPAGSSKPGTWQPWLVMSSIAGYAVVMAAIGTAGGTSLRPNSSWVLIPLCGQLIHYYLDAFIWRFSDPHIRKNVGRFLWAL